MMGEPFKAMSRVLRMATFDRLTNDKRITSHGLNILERWCQNETSTVLNIERSPDKLVAVLLDQQEWAPPFADESHDHQLKNGLVEYEIREMGGQDLSCHHALERLGSN